MKSYKSFRSGPWAHEPLGFGAMGPGPVGQHVAHGRCPPLNGLSCIQRKFKVPVRGFHDWLISAPGRGLGWGVGGFRELSAFRASPEGPGPMGPGPVGPGPMGPGPVGPGPVGPGPKKVEEITKRRQNKPGGDNSEKIIATSYAQAKT